MRTETESGDRQRNMQSDNMASAMEQLVIDASIAAKAQPVRCETCSGAEGSR